MVGQGIQPRARTTLVSAGEIRSNKGVGSSGGDMLSCGIEGDLTLCLLARGAEGTVFVFGGWVVNQGLQAFCIEARKCSHGNTEQAKPSQADGNDLHLECCSWGILRGQFLDCRVMVEELCRCVVGD